MSLSMFRRILGPPFLLVVVLFGCKSESDNPQTDDPIECNSDLECPQDEICVRSMLDQAGFCERGECNRERQCENGQCDALTRTCVSPNPVFCMGETCPAGRRCDRDRNLCVPSEPQWCEIAQHCPNGFCVNGLCKYVDCVVDADCDAQQRCSPDFQCIDNLVACQDGDGDGYGVGPCLGEDCDDGDPSVHPGMLETGFENCGDGIDNNCDGRDVPCSRDDQDLDGTSIQDGDCDDTDPTVSPTRSEIPYNSKDDDCNPNTSDDDVDRDGFRASSVGGEDCDDQNASVNPNAVEIPGNGIDEDCDEVDSVPTTVDEDRDGFSEAQGDCLDSDPDVYPGRGEIPYNGRDDDCNPATPDDDLDEDSFSLAEDCNDGNPMINPSRREIYYNGLDDDCNPFTRDEDADGDGYRAVEVGGSDCSDLSAAVNPGMVEVPYNGLDDDCNELSPDDDLDQDGFTVADGDCDDTRGIISPAIIENARENCGDGIDNNCIGGDVPCEENVDDIDGDGVLPPEDCAPSNPFVPGIREILGNDIDDDCDPTTPDLLPECLDDQFDENRNNGSAGQATAVEDGNTQAVQYGGLVLCPMDEDWYTISVGRGDGLEIDIFFQDQIANLDLHLYRENEDGSLTRIDSGVSSTDNETVYVRSSIKETTRYFARVFRSVDRFVSAPYQLSVNVFRDCIDDPVGIDGEHNDACLNTAPDFSRCLEASASRVPPLGQRRQICDYDSDLYTFEVGVQQVVRIDLLFEHTRGDLDGVLYNENGEIVGTATSTTDNEVIEQFLVAGTYYLLVRGYRDAQNEYGVLLSSGQRSQILGELSCLELEECPVFGACCSQSRTIPDYNAQGYGVLFEEIEVIAPAGSVIRHVEIKSLELSHTYLRDLKITVGWDGVEKAVLWNRVGDEQGRDGGLDDDLLRDRDIEMKGRILNEFGGLAGTGTFYIRVEDQLPGDSGELEELEIAVEYLTALQ